MGDWVVGVPVGDGLSIHALVPRRTVLVRKAAGDSDDEQVLAANVDTALVMSSLNAELNPRRLERFLTLVWDGGVRPVVLLSKADLVPDATVLATVRKTVADVAPDVSVHELSVREGHGLEALDAYFGPGQTAVLLGSSGVGKSTLVNHLLGREATRTQDIREHDQKGKHTTTSRNLFRLPGGALLIDTPGMRELQMLDHEEGLAALFPEIEALILACRFNDCGHVSEPGCAIKVALADGSLPADRWAARNKLDAEIAARERRDDKALSSREKRRYKKAEKEMKANFKQKKWDQ